MRNGKWDKLDDGTWGIQVRVGGNGMYYVGKTVLVRRKDRSSSHEVLGELVTDYGPGDVAVFRMEQTNA